WARDGGCRFPGCGRKRFVDAHHIEHWSTGGETSLANLMLLCSKHHTLVHEGGFRIEKDYRDRWFFRRPDGRAVPACGYRAADTRDDGVAVEDEYFAVHGSVHTSAEASRVAEPSAEAYGAKRARRQAAHHHLSPQRARMPRACANDHTFRRSRSLEYNYRLELESCRSLYEKVRDFGRGCTTSHFSASHRRRVPGAGVSRGIMSHCTGR